MEHLSKSQWSKRGRAVMPGSTPVGQTTTTSGQLVDLYAEDQTGTPAEWKAAKEAELAKIREQYKDKPARPIPSAVRQRPRPHWFSYGDDHEVSC